MARAAARNSTTAPENLAVRLRRRIAARINGHLSEAERLIAALDEMDGDIEAEPTLGSTASAIQNQEFWAQGDNGAALDDCEARTDDDLSCEDPFGGNFAAAI